MGANIMYYIASGFGNGMYTLRQHSLIPTNYGIKEEDRYIKNLSRDYQKAIIKAKAFVGDHDKLEIGTAWNLEKWGEAEKPQRYEAPELTPKQIAYLEEKAKKKAKQEAEYAEIKRKQKEAYDKAEKIPVTDQRIILTGVIDKIYHKQNEWGGQWRMFFIDDRGFKLNGGVGQSFKEKHFYNDEDDYHTTFFENGSRVTFMAKVTPSNDPKFGFFKRPTQVQLIKDSK